MLKALLWLGSSRSDARNFPADARQRAGYELFLVQSGLPPSDWKPMSSVGAGVQEIRVRTGREHRIFYVARYEEAVYVLHAFEKKARKTPKADLDLARSRLRAPLRARRTASEIQEQVMKIERSSGNVFRDLGFEPRQAESLRLRAQLMAELKRLIRARKLTQHSAARLLGVTQPRVSDLVRGKIELFSIEGLVNMLARAGVRVQLRLAPARRPPRHQAA